jgi:hypothetical protein
MVILGMSFDGHELAMKRVLKVNYRGLESWLTKVRRLQMDNRFLARYFVSTLLLYSSLNNRFFKMKIILSIWKASYRIAIWMDGSNVFCHSPEVIS